MGQYLIIHLIIYSCILFLSSFCDSSNGETTRSNLSESRLRLHYYHGINYPMEGRTIIFNGDSNVKEFISKNLAYPSFDSSTRAVIAKD